MSAESPFNPLDYRNIGRSISEALLRQSVVPLLSVNRFHGSGIYSIYYTGKVFPFPPYKRLIQAHIDDPFSQPIYVGKAEPSGSRKGVPTISSVDTKLSDRLLQHARSIQSASTTLNLDDFYCRFLIVEPVWIPLGESILINLTRPVWNLVVEGFGNHDPGNGRSQGVCPTWDTIHPGRVWATRLPVRSETVESIYQRIESFLLKTVSTSGAQND